MMEDSSLQDALLLNNEQLREIERLRVALNDMDHYRLSLDGSRLYVDKLVRGRAALLQALETTKLSNLRLQKSNLEQLAQITELTTMLVAHIERGRRLASKLEKKVQELAKLQTEKHVLDGKITELELVILMKDQRFQGLRDEALTKSDILQMDLDFLQRKYKKCQADRDLLLEKLNAAERQAVFDRQKILELRETAARQVKLAKELKDSNLKLKLENNSAQEELARLESQVRDLTVRLSTSTSNADRTRQDLATKTDLLNEAIKAKQSLKNELGSLLEKNSALQTANAVLSTNVANKDQQLDAAATVRIQNLQELEKLRGQLTEMERLAVVVSEDISEMTEAVNQSSLSRGGLLSADATGHTLTVYARSLIKIDWLSLPSPCVAVFVSDTGKEDDFMYYSKTGVLRNTLNPDFVLPIALPQLYASALLKLVVFDASSTELFDVNLNSTTMGYALLSASELLKKQAIKIALTSGVAKMQCRLRRSQSCIVVQLTAPAPVVKDDLTNSSDLGVSRERLLAFRSGLLTLIGKQTRREKNLLDQVSFLLSENTTASTLSHELVDKDRELAVLRSEVDNYQALDDQLEATKLVLVAKENTIAVKDRLVLSMQQEQARLQEHINNLQQQSKRMISIKQMPGGQLKMHVDKLAVLLDRVGAPVQRPLHEERKLGETNLQLSRFEYLNHALAMLLSKQAPPTRGSTGDIVTVSSPQIHEF